MANNSYQKVTLKPNLTKMLELQEQIEQLQQNMIQTVLEGKNAEEIAGFKRRLVWLRREGADVGSLIDGLDASERYGINIGGVC